MGLISLKVQGSIWNWSPKHCCSHLLPDYTGQCCTVGSIWATAVCPYELTLIHFLERTIQLTQ